MHIGTFNNRLCVCVSVYWQTNLSVCVCVSICMGVRQSGQTLSEARPTQQAMRVKRIICQYVRSFRICTASPVASCQFNHRHHHHPSSETVPGPPTVPQATLLDGHSCVFLLSMSLSPSPTTSSSSSSSSSSLSSFAVHTNSLCPPFIQLLAQSTYSSLDDCPTDCQTVRQSSISISTISTSLPSMLPSCPRLSFGWLLPPFG